MKLEDLTSLIPDVMVALLGRIGEGRLGFLGRGMNSSWVRVQEHRPGASTHRRARRDGFPF